MIVMRMIMMMVRRVMRMMMKIMRMCQGELLVSWVSGLDRAEGRPRMEEVVSLTLMITMMTMMMMTILMTMMMTNGH